MSLSLHLVVGGLGKRYVIGKCDSLFTFNKGATTIIMSSLQHLLSRGYSMGAEDAVKQLAYQLTVTY